MGRSIAAGAALLGPLCASASLGGGAGGEVDQVLARQIGVGQSLADRGVVEQADHHEVA
jgi:hypothetical protein